MGRHATLTYAAVWSGETRGALAEVPVFAIHARPAVVAVERERQVYYKIQILLFNISKPRIQRCACSTESCFYFLLFLPEWTQTTRNLVQTTSRADEVNVKRTIGSELHAPLEWQKLGVPLSQRSERVWESAAQLYGPVYSGRTVCVNVLPGLTMGVGCSRWYLKERERERERVCFIHTHASTEESTKQSTCHGLRGSRMRTCGRVGVQIGRVAECCALFGKRLPTFSPFSVFKASGLSVHADASERVGGVQQYTRKDLKKKERGWAWDICLHFTSFTFFPS